jgi:hypothetical protein
MEIININGYGVIEVENQEVLNILNKFSQEDLVIFGKLGYKYIDVEDSMRFSSIIYDYYTQQEVTKYNIEKVLPGNNLYNKDGVWVSSIGANLRIIITEDSITGISEDYDYNKTYNFSDYETVSSILKEIWEYNFNHSSYLRQLGYVD